MLDSRYRFSPVKNQAKLTDRIGGGINYCCAFQRVTDPRSWLETVI